jgi:hypothetical protein
VLAVVVFFRLNFVTLFTARAPLTPLRKSTGWSLSTLTAFSSEVRNFVFWRLYLSASLRSTL